MTDRIISKKELLTLVPYGFAQITRMEKAGTFPRRIKLGPNRIGWLFSEIQGWIMGRKQERDLGLEPYDLIEEKRERDKKDKKDKRKKELEKLEELEELDS